MTVTRHLPAVMLSLTYLPKKERKDTVNKVTDAFDC